ncbi:MAG: CapA family protein [bacterium]|nr:CapA family protein [bacterium]
MQLNSNYAKVGVDTFDFTGVYREVKQYLSAADLTVGNLETVVACKNKGYSGYPYFNAPDDFNISFSYAGFDFLITANNYALDQGWEGVKRTIEVMNEYKIHSTGTFYPRKTEIRLKILK